MRKSQKIKKLEAAFKNSFNASSAGSFSPNWQSELLDRLHHSRTFKLFNRQSENKFERDLWKVVWISFAVSTAIAIFVIFYTFIPGDFSHDLNNAFYSDVAMHF
jgi:hypothetical protein